MGKKVVSNEISAILVVKNESKKLPGCLESIKWVHEKVVIDNNSTDNTVDIANGYGAKVFHQKGGTFSSRKNFAAKKASGSWILFLDADERVTSELKEELSQIIGSRTEGVFAIPRRNIILGREMAHDRWGQDYVIRFFKKESFIGFSGELHEQPSYKGKLEYTKSYLTHTKHDNLSDMVEKTNEWSQIEAKLMFEANHPKMNIVRFCSAGAREFWLRVVRNVAFLDGTEGVIYAMYQVYSRLISYAKLWEMQLNKTENPNTKL